MKIKDTPIAEIMRNMLMVAWGLGNAGARVNLTIEETQKIEVEDILGCNEANIDINEIAFIDEEKLHDLLWFYRTYVFRGGEILLSPDDRKKFVEAIAKAGILRFKPKERK